MLSKVLFEVVVPERDLLSSSTDSLLRELNRTKLSSSCEPSALERERERSYY